MIATIIGHLTTAQAILFYLCLVIAGVAIGLGIGRMTS